MQQQNFVVCDKEIDYASNFLEMVAQKKGTQVNLHLFQELEDVAEFSHQHPIHYLVIDERFLPEEREKIPSEKRFVWLREQGGQLLETEIGVEKYQSVEKSLRQIFATKPEGMGTPGRHREEVRLAGTGGIDERERREGSAERRERTEGREVLEVDHRSKGRVIGIYSPIHRIGKTQFALELGKELSKKEPVLYLNLEGYAGSTYFQEHQEQDLASLLYYARQETGNLGLKISMLAGQIGGLDYIEPITVVQDLQSVQGEEWKELCEQILQQCIYEVIILDIGDGIQGLYDILAYCDTVYTPYIEEPTALSKLKQYTDNLIRTGYEVVLEHTIQKKMRKGTKEHLLHENRQAKASVHGLHA